jgi:hypothetical protein
VSPHQRTGVPLTRPQRTRIHIQTVTGGVRRFAHCAHHDTTTVNLPGELVHVTGRAAQQPAVDHDGVPGHADDVELFGQTLHRAAVRPDLLLGLVLGFDLKLDGA